MIITLSPAKIMEFRSPQRIEPTEPVFKQQRDEIIALLQQLSVDEMKNLMDLNQQQIELVFPKIHQFGTEKAPVASAAFAYNGIAYKGLDFKTLQEDEIIFAQKHLLILSAVYGFLHPLDCISPYRLEMQTELKNPKGKTLFDYWRKTLTDYLAEKLAEDDGIWLNLSSNEYTKVIDKKKLGKGIQIITPQFKEETAKGYRQVIVHTKKARGMMARFVIQHKISTAEDIKAFDSEGFCYAAHLSSENEPIFIR